MNEEKIPFYKTPEFISNLGGFLKDGISLFQGPKSSNQILQETPVTTGNGAGFTFLKYKPIDFEGQKSEWNNNALTKTVSTAASGAALGNSIVPGIGGALGGALGFIGGGISAIFGGQSLKKRLERAQERKVAINGINYADAQTQYLQQNEDPVGGYMMTYHGKDRRSCAPKYYSGKNAVHTSAGKMYATPNAMSDYGEAILDNLNDEQYATGHVVDEGRGKRDANYARVGSDTVILGNDINWTTGKPFKKDGEEDTRRLELINKMFDKPKKTANKFRGVIGEMTDLLLQQQVAKLKKPIVDRLSKLADQQKYQHDTMSMYYLQDPIGYMPRFEDGKDPKKIITFKPAAINEELPEYNPVYANPYWYVDNEPARIINPAKKSYSVLPVRFMPDSATPNAVPQDMGRPFGEKPGDTNGKDMEYDRVPQIPSKYSWAYNLPSMIGGLGQFLTASGSKMKQADVSAKNLYAPGALQKLAKMRINGRDLVNNAIYATRRGRYNSMQSGGLTAGQRWFDNIVREGKYADLIANIAREVMAQNNAYDTAYAQAALAEGRAEADRREKAKQYAEEYAARAHAAKQAGIQSGLSNMYAALQQMGANEFNRLMYNGTLGVWQQELKNRLLA